MNKLAHTLLSLLAMAALAACGKQQSSPTPAEPPAATAPAATTSANAAPAAEAAAEAATESTPAVPAETISETEDAQPAPAEQQASTVQPALRLGAAAAAPATSAQFKEGTNYQKIVPAQPTSVGPGKVEVVEVFWYGCAHCFALDPALESWRSKGKPAYVEFVRVPAMWNDMTRMHARVYYAAELLGKLDQLHSLIFREIHVNQDPLDTLEKISAFFQKQGVSKEEFTKAFSSFAVESKLQRADFLNRRYRVQSVPLMVVNGKYTTDLSTSGGEQQLFTLIGELAAHEHGG